MIRNAHLFSGADWNCVIRGLHEAVNEKCVWVFKNKNSTIKIMSSNCDFRPSIRQCKCCTCQHAVGIRLLVNCAILGLLEVFRLHKSTFFWFWYLPSKTLDIIRQNLSHFWFSNWLFHGSRNCKNVVPSCKVASFHFYPLSNFKDNNHPSLFDTIGKTF